MLIKKSYTLIEILVVMVVIGILASLGLPNYGKLKEKALDREAKATLALMRAAQKIYKMENSSYYPEAAPTSTEDPVLINEKLRLSLPTVITKWRYGVDNDSGEGTVMATRTEGSFIRVWSLDSSAASDEKPDLSCSGSCLE